MLQWWFWANADLGKAFTRYSRQSSSLTDNWLILAVFVAIPLLWVALAYWDKWRKQSIRNGDSPKTLFLELCLAHKLNRSERSLLLKAVEARRLGQAALVFVDPTILGKLAAAKSTDAGGYKRLAKRLFGQSATGRI